jgi:CRP-like cAMP-binding protein
MHRAGREDHPERQDFGWLVPLAVTRDLVPGETLFRKDDPADRLFVVVDGEITVPEFDVRLGPGALFGEIGVLSADGRRTASARATGHVRLAEMTAERVERLYFDDPEFAWRLIRLVTARLVGNARSMEARAAAREAALAARERAATVGPPDARPPDAASGPH